jgi:hypothetical protein
MSGILVRARGFLNEMQKHSLFALSIKYALTSAMSSSAREINGYFYSLSNREILNRVKALITI